MPSTGRISSGAQPRGGERNGGRGTIGRWWSGAGAAILAVKQGEVIKRTALKLLFKSGPNAPAVKEISLSICRKL